MALPPASMSIRYADIIPHLRNYELTCQTFSWEEARSELQGRMQGPELNIAHEAIDHHCAAGRGQDIALRWLGADGRRQTVSYDRLKEESSRFAHILEFLEIPGGETVFSLTPRIPLLFAVIMGTLKHLNVFCPLFETFGPEPVRQRLSQGKAAVLVTTASHYRGKVEPFRNELPYLRHILLVDAEHHPGNTVWSLPRLLQEAHDDWNIPATSPDDPALLFFTSGTTGMPKGALHTHGAATAHYASAKFALDLHPGDILWCTADPGWVTGAIYSIIAPLLHGITTLVDEADFDAGRWLEILATEKVSVLYTSPSAIRRLMRLEDAFFTHLRLPHLRAIHSVGEPLDAAAVLWAERVLGCPIHDTWWQTETGSIMIANFPAMSIKPGSMGRPLPGITAAILTRDSSEGGTAGNCGLLALKSDWPSLFRRYIDDEERYRQCFSGDWYLSGDLARVDSDGYFWFCGRADDIIKTAGHMVGPFEVEAVLTAHPAVAEAAVLGRPDSMLGEIVQACIILKAGIAPSELLKRELLAFARKRLGPALAPRHIDFRQQLPRNRAGKVMRRVLKDFKPEFSAADAPSQTAEPSPAQHRQEKRGEEGDTP